MEKSLGKLVSEVELKKLKIIPIQKQNFYLAEQFILQKEEQCVSLSSFVRRRSENLFFVIEGKELFSVNQIVGIFYLNNTFFHFFPEITKIQNPVFINQFIDFLKINNLKIKSVNGEKNSTQIFLNILKEINSPYQINNYNLMTLNFAEQKKLPSPNQMFNDEHIIRCTQNDMENLFLLEKKYLVEEVLPFNRKITDIEVTLNLRRILKNQLCFALVSDGEIVSKANTNAIGLNFVQLGGIYTLPQYRQNGYARQTVCALCRRIFYAKKNVALFVKEKNYAAAALYNSLNFRTVGQYIIAYFY